MVTAENTQMVPTENVCVADEEKILCIVRDMLDTECHGIRHSINLPASTMVKDMISQVAKQFGYIDDTIDITYEKQTGAEIHEVSLGKLEYKKLQEVCLSGIKKHNFTITEKEETLPQKVQRETSSETTTSSSGISSSSGSSSYVNGASTSTSTSAATDTCFPNQESYSYATAVIKSDTDYVGLVNQAMTCYLNSLLQTLYMTPEFRNAVYRWEFDGKEDNMAKSIPYQLQKLFLLLQTSKKKAIETTDLTKSFGWDSSEVWQQHDVQELCRVMFDALEQKWKKTDQANLINNLYQGKLKDYVKCLECGNESARLDTYLDIPLVIRPFGSNETHGSVDEALQAFVEPETLDENNQYFCEKCNKKCNAHKGLKFVSFPYLLTMQLKRFDFDYTTLHRIKLNDRMTFPAVLNLNHLIKPEQVGSEEPTSNSLEVSSDEGIDEGIEIESNMTGTSAHNVSLSSEAVANDKNVKAAGAKGPYVYELFSIMVHSGSAAGGHYYAYIKSFKDGEWYSFNDQHVSKVTYEDITKTYGGSSTSRGYYSSTYTSSTNAYMLMYRQIDKRRNKDFIQPENFPEHLILALQSIKEREEHEIRQKELEKSTCKIKVYYFDPRERRKIEQKLEVHKDKTLKETTEICSQLFKIEKSVPLDCCRLVKFDEYQDTLECSFENEDDTPMGLLLGGVKQAYNFDLLLETKRPEQVFQEYRPGGVTVKLYVADLQNDIIQEPPVSVRAYHAQTVSQFKTMVAEVLSVSADKMRCVLERFHNDLKFLSVPNKTLKAEGFFKSNKVYIEFSGEEEATHFTHTHFFRLLDRHQNTIRIHVNLPPSSDVEEFLKSSSRHDQLMKSAITSGKSREDSSTSLEVGSKTGSDSLDEGISDRGSDSEIEFKTKKITLSKSDPSIYHSCQSIDIGRVSFHSSASEGRACSPVGLSSSSQDTSTSAEFNVPTSYRGLCNIYDGHEDATDSVLGDSNGREPVEHGESDSEQTAPPSPGERVIHDTDFKQEENWDSDCDNDVTVTKEEVSKRYFHIVLNETDVLTKQRNLTVLVDKRITLGAFKGELEPHVGTTSDNFKVYRVYSNNQEFESIRLTETLSFFEDGKLNIKLGRALKPGEYRVKIYQLLVNDPEPGKFLIDTIFAKGMSVLESKKLVIPEIREQCGIDIPLERCRLRKKTWRNPGTVYIDSQIKLVDDDSPPERLWYEVNTRPNNGILAFKADHQRPIKTFTQKDVDGGNIIFTQTGPPIPSFIELNITDGKFPRQTVTVAVSVVSLTLEMIKNDTIYIPQASTSVYITQEQLDSKTNGDRSKILYTITRPPLHGRIYVRSYPVTTFTQLDLEKLHEVMYVQQDLNYPSDHFFCDVSYQGSDLMVVNKKISISVKPFVKQNPAKLSKGSNQTLISLLSLDARGLANVTGSVPHYKIINQPKFGVIVNTARRKRDVEEGYQEVEEFTHTDIEYHRIYYVINRPVQGQSEDRMTYLLTARGVQPAIGDFVFKLPYTRGANGSDVDNAGSREVVSPSVRNDFMIILAILIPLFVVVILGVIIVYLLWRKRRYQNYVPPTGMQKNQLRPEISGPIPLNQPHVHIEPNDNASDDEHSLVYEHHNYYNIPVVKRNVSEDSISDFNEYNEVEGATGHTQTEVSATIPECKVTPLGDLHLRDSIVSQSSVDLFDWSVMDDPELLQFCRTTAPVLKENQYWV